MRKLSLILATFALGLASAGIFAGVSQATTQSPDTATKADLVMTGSVAGGETSTESFHLIVFVFTLTDKGPGDIDSSADTTVTTVDGGTLVDTMCVLRNGFGINPDGPSCEQGPLAIHQSVKSTFIVQPTTGHHTVSVTACGSNESAIPDAVPSNNCKTLSVAID
jgi:hypothetical protein